MTVILSTAALGFMGKPGAAAAVGGSLGGAGAVALAIQGQKQEDTSKKEEAKAD